MNIIYAYHMNLYISETDMEPVLEFLRAKAMRQLYEYAGLGKPESLGCMPLPVTTFFLIMLLGVRGAPERWWAPPLGLGTCCMGELTGGRIFNVFCWWLGWVVNWYSWWCCCCCCCCWATTPA